MRRLNTGPGIALAVAAAVGLAALLAALLAAFLTGRPVPIAALRFEIRRNLEYSKIGDQQLRLDAFVPEGKGPIPAVLVVHGGSWKEGDRRQLTKYATSLAGQGFVCFAIDYRLAPQHYFPAQIEDCRTAVAWIRSHSDEFNVDPQRLGAAGYSAGGHLVSLLATTGEPPSAENGNVDTRLQAVVAGGAPTDFREFPEDNGEWARYWMGGNLDTVPEKFLQASSTAYVDKDDPPVFFFNGIDDGVVPIEWSLACYNELKRAGVRTESYRIQGASHMKAMFDADALDKAWAFLRRELQNEGTDQ